MFAPSVRRLGALQHASSVHDYDRTEGASIPLVRKWKKKAHNSPHPIIYITHYMYVPYLRQPVFQTRRPIKPIRSYNITAFFDRTVFMQRVFDECRHVTIHSHF